MKRFLGILVLIALVATPLMAQTTNGNLYLTITDESGAVQAGVGVVLTGQDFARTVTSNDEGEARFINLTVGVYELVLKNAGFNTMILQGIQIDSGANATFDVKMQRSDLVEEVVVTAITPLLNKRSMGTSTIFTKSEIEQTPNARDPWSIISSIPGVTSDRVNVAGSEAGQQAQFVGKGDDGDQTVWKMDGVEFTDIAAVGGSSTYLDFNSFEQIDFTTAGGNFATQTGGVQMEFVTKQGSNRVTGTARLLYTDSGLQGTNNEGLEQPDWYTGSQNIAGNTIEKLFEKNFDMGGPLLKDKLWWWFGFTENDINVNLITGQPDKTELRNISGKLHGQWAGKLTYKVFYTNGDKVKLGRGGGINRPPETTWDQSGPTPIWGANISYFFTPDLEVTFQYSKVEGGFAFTPNGDFTQQIFRDATGIYHNTFSIYETDRPQDQYLIKGNYFFDTGSWDHELKFGFRYKDATVDSFSKYSNADMISNKYYTPNYVYLYRELNTSVDMEYTNLWIGDTILHGPWTINAGFHYSDQSGVQAASASRANGTFPNLIEGLAFGGFDPGFSWSDISPRVGVTYTFDFEKRLLLRGSYAQYADQMGSGVVSYNLPLTYVGVRYDWNDLNGDDFVDQDELVDIDGSGTVDCLDSTGSYNIDPCNTGSATSPFKIDTGLSAPSVEELVLGLDWELAKDFVLGANYTTRKRDNLVWTPIYNNTLFQADGTLQTIDNRAIYSCNLNVSGTAPDGTTTYDEDYCQITDTTDVGSGNPRWETNMPDYSQSYNEFEIVATKRLSSKWRMRAFVAYSKWENDFSGATPYLSSGTSNNAGTQSGEPTNYRGGTTDNGGLIGVQSLSSGNKRDVFVGSSNWQFNINGLYQLPKGWAISGNLYGRQGYGLPNYAVGGVDPASGEGNKNIQSDAIDTERYDDLIMFDLRVSKMFTLAGDANVEIAAEYFNALNDNTVLQQGQRLDNTTFQRIGEIVSPKIWRFVATVNF